MYCQRLVPLLEQVLEKNPMSVKIVFKNFPIRRHAFSEKAAAAALVAHGYGKFWQYHDRLFAADVFGKINDRKLADIAAEIGIDPKAFENGMRNPEILAKVQRDAADGQRAGVRGTPTIFINGRQLKTRSLDGFQEIIDRELELKGQRPK